MPEKYKIFPGNKYFMNYSTAIGPFKKNHMNCFGIKAICLDVNVLIHFLLERTCSKHQRSNSWLEYESFLQDRSVKCLST